MSISNHPFTELESPNLHLDILINGHCLRDVTCLFLKQWFEAKHGPYWNEAEFKPHWHLWGISVPWYPNMYEKSVSVACYSTNVYRQSKTRSGTKSLSILLEKWMKYLSTLRVCFQLSIQEIVCGNFPTDRFVCCVVSCPHLALFHVKLITKLFILLPFHYFKVFF